MEPKPQTTFAEPKKDFIKILSQLENGDAPSKNLTFNKPNEIVCMVPDEGSKITLIQRLLLNALYNEVCKQGDKPRYELYLIDLIRAVGITEENHAYIYKQLKALQKLTYDRSVFTEYGPGDDEQDKSSIPYISVPGIITRKGRPTRIYFHLEQTLKERVLNPINGFTALPLSALSTFKTGPEVALAEICYRYRTNFAGKSYGTTGAKPPEWWIPRLLGHHPRENYEFKFFRRDVLNKIIPAINTNKTIPFIIEGIIDKPGKMVKTLAFHIFDKAGQLPNTPAANPKENNQGEGGPIGIPSDCLYLIQKIQNNIGGTQADAISVIKSLPDKTKLEEHLRLYQEQIASGWKPLSPIASFKTRVRDDWGSGKSAVQYSNKAATHQSHTPIASILPNPVVEQGITKIASAVQKFNALSGSEQQIAIDLFLAQASDYLRGAYREKGMSPHVQGSFNAWLDTENYFG